MKPKTVGRVSGKNLAATPPMICGLPADDMILTMDGEKPVCDLVTGDSVITRTAGSARITHISSSRIRVPTVRILAGSLGDTRPESDTHLPAGQPVFIRDWRAKALFGTPTAMVPARSLIDGEFITDEGMQELSLYRFRFDAPQVLYVNGLELGSDISLITVPMVDEAAA